MTKTLKASLALAGLALFSCVGGGAILMSAAPENQTNPVRALETMPGPAPESTKAAKPSPPDPNATIYSGVGMFKIGSGDVGTYRTNGLRKGKALCYYHTAKTTGNEAIVDQGVVAEEDQPAFITLKKGQWFKTDGCQDWYLQKK